MVVDAVVVDAEVVADTEVVVDAVEEAATFGLTPPQASGNCNDWSMVCANQISAGRQP